MHSEREYAFVHESSKPIRRMPAMRTMFAAS